MIHHKKDKIEVYVLTELKIKLKKRSQEMGITMSEFIKRLLESTLV